MVDLVKPRARKLTDIMPLIRPFVLEPIDRDPSAVARYLADAALRPHLAEWRNRLRVAESFTAAPLESALRQLAAERGLKAGPLIHATRVAVTGQAVSPGLFDVLELMGRDRVVSRLLDADRLIARARRDLGTREFRSLMTKPSRALSPKNSNARVAY